MCSIKGNCITKINILDLLASMDQIDCTAIAAISLARNDGKEPSLLLRALLQLHLPSGSRAHLSHAGSLHPSPSRHVQSALPQATSLPSRASAMLPHNPP
jgi:hypothetical protein